MEWHAFIDGASSGNPGEAGAGIVVFDPHGAELFKESLYLGRMTNNMAEYEALLRVIRRAHASAIRRLHVSTDSQLVARQITGEYKIRNARLSRYYEKAVALIRSFDSFSIRHIPREENKLADKLAKDGVKNKGRWVVAGYKPEESPGIAGQDGP